MLTKHALQPAFNIPQANNKHPNKGNILQIIGGAMRSVVLMKLAPCRWLSLSAWSPDLHDLSNTPEKHTGGSHE